MLATNSLNPIQSITCTQIELCPDVTNGGLRNLATDMENDIRLIEERGLEWVEKYGKPYKYIKFFENQQNINRGIECMIKSVLSPGDVFGSSSIPDQCNEKSIFFMSQFLAGLFDFIRRTAKLNIQSKNDTSLSYEDYMNLFFPRREDVEKKASCEVKLSNCQRDRDDNARLSNECKLDLGSNKTALWYCQRDRDANANLSNQCQLDLGSNKTALANCERDRGDSARLSSECQLDLRSNKTALWYCQRDRDANANLSNQCQLDLGSNKTALSNCERDRGDNARLSSECQLDLRSNKTALWYCQRDRDANANLSNQCQLDLGSNKTALSNCERDRGDSARLSSECQLDLRSNKTALSTCLGDLQTQNENFTQKFQVAENNCKRNLQAANKTAMDYWNQWNNCQLEMQNKTQVLLENQSMRIAGFRVSKNIPWNILSVLVGALFGFVIRWICCRENRSKEFDDSDRNQETSSTEEQKKNLMVENRTRLSKRWGSFDVNGNSRLSPTKERLIQASQL